MKKILLCLLLINTIVIKSQTQFLDSTFGVNGIYSNIFSLPYTFEAGAITSQQKIIILSGYTNTNNTRTNIVQRLNVNGTLDSSFNTYIRLPQSITGVYDDLYLSKICIQADEKILLSDLQFRTLIRLNADGTIDTTFGNNGTVNVLELSSILGGFGLTTFAVDKIQDTSNNKFLVGVKAFDYNNFVYKFLVLRFNNNGTLDTGFGNNGAVIQDGHYGTMITQGNFKFVVSSFNDSTMTTHINRYTSDGQIDSTFNNNNYQFTASAPYENYIINSTGNSNAIYLYGLNSAPSNIHLMTLIKFDENGILDNSFGINGVKTEPFYNNGSYLVNNNVLFQSVFLDTNGNVFVSLSATQTNSASNYNQFIKKFTSSGNVDLSFGNNGIVEVDLGYSESVRSSILGHDNKILIFGNSNSNKGIISKVLNNTNSLVTKDVISKENICIYPNPIKDFIFIESKLSLNNSVVEIFDYNGRLVFKGYIKNNKIDVRGLEIGSYFLKINNFSQKILKQ